MGKLSRALQKAAQERKALDQPPDSKALEPEARQALPFDVVPYQARNGRKPDAHLVCLTGENPDAAAQVRQLRNKLLARPVASSCQVLAISSATRAEGKSVTAGNLAIALAEIENSRVLLIDGDLSGPCQHRLFGVKRRQVLTDVLADNFEIKGRVYGTPAQNVHLMPAKGLPDGGATLVSRAGWKELLARVRPFYDFVVVDTAPVMASPAAAILASGSDAVIMTIRINKTSRHTVMRALDDLEKVGADIVGCVLTFAKHHIPDSVYRFVGTTKDHYYSNYRER